MKSQSVNKVILVGRLGADPELRYTSSGRPRCSMRIATNRSYLDKEKNEWTEQTCWHRVVAWGKQGELCKEYLGRGRLVLVEGRLDNRSYTGKDGQQRWAQEVVSDSVLFLDRRGGSSASEPGGGGQPPSPVAAAPADEESIDDHDLPF
jgi:single-strand DNA-binding protein